VADVIWFLESGGTPFWLVLSGPLLHFRHDSRFPAIMKLPAHSACAASDPLRSSLLSTSFSPDAFWGGLTPLVLALITKGRRLMR